MDLAFYIEELLYKNDCVILPTIGGFIVNPTTAQIDFVEQQLCPPNKTVSFNPKLVNNDGLLVHHVSQRQHISYKRAQADIEVYTRQIEQELFENKIVHFDNIGKLYFNSDSKLEFVPEETNFLRSAYGLPTISCRPILRSKDYLKQPASATATATIPRRSKRKGTAFLTPIRIVVAAAVLLFILGGSYIRSTYFNQPNSTNPTIAAKKTITPAKKEQQVAAASILPSTTSTPIEASTEEIVTEEEPTTTIDDTPVVDENTENYIIVLGAFGKEKNAYRLADKLAKDNYLPDVTVKNGLNRVGVQLNCTPEELAEHLQFLQKNYNKKAWVVD